MADYFEEMEGACTKHKLDVFSHAYYSYINQIFGDDGVRKLIQKLYKKPGVLVIEEIEATADGFEEGTHHVFSPSKKSKKSAHVCSVIREYQNVTVDKEDTLCQSYSLMTYFQIPFDTTTVAKSTHLNKFNRQMSIVYMYKALLANPEFVEQFKKLIAKPAYKKLWEDHTRHFYIVERLTADDILSNIRTVLSVWERYGWKNFVKEGISCALEIAPDEADLIITSARIAAETAVVPRVSVSPRRLFHTPVAAAGAGAPVSVNAASKRLFYSPPAPTPTPAPSAPKRGRSHSRTVKANNNANNNASPPPSSSASGSRTRSKRRRNSSSPSS